jgi:hypothetical protein
MVVKCKVCLHRCRSSPWLDMVASQCRLSTAILYLTKVISQRYLGLVSKASLACWEQLVVGQVLLEWRGCQRQPQDREVRN